MKKVLVTTFPFCKKDTTPIRLLKEANISFDINPYNRKMNTNELRELISEYDAIIAGTEIIDNSVFEKSSRLKFISRVGIGLDGIDLLSARLKKIQISYTPDAPSLAVADLTIGLIISSLRSICLANNQLHLKKWDRVFGRRIENLTIGIIGCGRIGKHVLNYLQVFKPKKLLVNDLYVDETLSKILNFEWVSKNEIYKNADVISLHLPLNNSTKNLINKNTLLSMKQDAVLINTSRGGIINEQDLFDVLNLGHLSSAAIDVFEIEPYVGDLTKIDRCILTSHMGSMTEDCRTRMEIEATEEVIRFFTGNKLLNEVPDSEY
jgi:D-3-phosphoglycerate dehydrogenase